MNIYEKMHTFLAHLSNPVIFEMGVHWGEDTRRIMNYCTNEPRLYYGFEPDPRNIGTIHKHKYNLPYELLLVEGAISDQDGRSTFHLSDGENATNGNQMTGANSLRAPAEVLTRHSWISFEKEIEVATYRLDTFCQDHNIQKIDFIWADIQGSEYDMLKGAGDMLNNIGMLFLEYSPLELYKGQKDLKAILSLFDDRWEVVEITPTDVLIKQTVWNG